MSDDEKKERKLLKKFSANTPGKRLLKLTGMTTSIASKVASQQLKGAFQSAEKKQDIRTELLRDVGQQVAQTLGEMKGAVMKVGQVASQIKDLLPEGFSDALEKLQKDSPPMPYSVIREQLIAEFNCEPEELFTEIDEKPFAAASIGQVHRAKTKDGKDVVIKVQYPGIDTSIESDLKQLRIIIRLGGLVQIEKKLLDEIFNEIKIQLREELDYEHEAENLKVFRRLYEDDEKIIVPDVIDELTTKRILTLIYEPGDDLDKVKNTYSQELRNEIGGRVIDMIVKQIYVFNLIHADPHPGNFAFRENGAIIIYDFGAVKPVLPELTVRMAKLVNIAIENDMTRIDESLLELGARKKGAKIPPSEYYSQWMELINPAFSEELFDFGTSRLHIKIALMAKTSGLKYFSSFQPVPSMMYVNRVFAGHYWTLVSLGAQQSYRGIIKQYTEKI